MYINFWYPVGKSDEITGDKPYRSQILGSKFVAFRDQDGKAHVLSDTCVHRGGSLSKGWVKDGCVVCPYHGWQYSGDGICKTIPSIGYDGKPPARAKVDAYPVQEKYGIVFAFLGDLPEQERPPLYHIEEYETDEWRLTDIIILDVDFYFERSIENGLDPSHNEFVHPFQGAPALDPKYRTEPLVPQDTPWGSGFTVSFSDRRLKDTELMELRNEGNTNAGSFYRGPNTLATWIQFSSTNSFHQYFFEAPVNENHTRIFFINLRNCMMQPEMDDDIRNLNMRVAEEDIAILSELNPMRTPDSNIKETFMPTDQLVVRYRQHLKGWENKGWRIDWKAFQAKQGDVAFAIPCPDRRMSGNWVLDTVPLIPMAQESRAAAE